MFVSYFSSNELGRQQRKENVFSLVEIIVKLPIGSEIPLIDNHNTTFPIISDKTGNSHILICGTLHSINEKKSNMTAFDYFECPQSTKQTKTSEYFSRRNLVFIYEYEYHKRLKVTVPQFLNFNACFLSDSSSINQSERVFAFPNNIFINRIRGRS
jgi:hypothetical protein